MVTTTAANSLAVSSPTQTDSRPDELACGKYVFCGGMPRSGSTWQYQIVSHLLEEHRGGMRGGFLERAEDFDHIEEQTERRAPWLTLKTHNGHAPYAAALRSGRALAVYSYRDVRDVTFSLMHKMNMTFDEIVHEKYMLEQCLIDHAFWTTQPDVLCQRYEDIMGDPVGSVQEIAAFLAVPLTEDAAVRLAAQYSLSANLSRARQLTQTLRDKGVDLDDPRNAVLHDEHSQLHWNHIRQGRIGGWREEATPLQIVTLAEMCGTWLLDNGYEADSRWVLPGVEHLASALSAAQQEVRAFRELHRQLALELHSYKQLGPLSLAVAHKLHRIIGCFPGAGKRLKRLLRRVGFKALNPDWTPPVPH